MFDMKANNVKVGDKLVTADGRVCEVVYIEYDSYYPYTLREFNIEWTVDEQGFVICAENQDGGDVVGFAEQPEATEPEAENKGVKSDQREHNHYFKDVRHLDFIDVYRVIDLWELKDPALQHALKKILVPGNRGHKDKQKDIQDVIDSCKRWQEMQMENEIKGYPEDEQ